MSGRHHRSRHIFRMISALALCLVLPASQAAAVDSVPAGEWRGILSTSGGTGPVYVGLKARPAGADGVRSADLRFGPPFNCALELRAQADAYALQSRNGGKFCDALSGWRAQLQAGDGMASGMQLTLSGREAPLVIALDQKAGAALTEAGRWRSIALMSAQLELVATAVRPGDVIGRLRYGAPRDCQVELRYAGHEAGALIAWIVANDRGYCRRLSDSQARMQLRPDGSAVLSLLLEGQPDMVSFERVP
ncbi:hypothetical protein [Xanthomonas arboricola]|uniref:Secreted protein n=1 Tax=Xanthomonas arboricola pv. guizotiae TaxID=487867 RepID=A0A2S7A4V2_9XANT|nr:hypothetical protein [Xanthomonas arboricola]PPU01926.1 hypothetical protein XarbCFBP7409_06025 [Xanthomonas arboricola pv. guizotiae]PPU24758.1 hypothetical protein XarbCFBP7408_07295 [Xanthomonas arboricola pv. guizotiae]